MLSRGEGQDIKEKGGHVIQLKAVEETGAGLKILRKRKGEKKNKGSGNSMEKAGTNAKESREGVKKAI